MSVTVSPHSPLTARPVVKASGSCSPSPTSRTPPPPSRLFASLPAKTGKMLARQQTPGKGARGSPLRDLNGPLAHPSHQSSSSSSESGISTGPSPSAHAARISGHNQRPRFLHGRESPSKLRAKRQSMPPRTDNVWARRRGKSAGHNNGADSSDSGNDDDESGEAATGWNGNLSPAGPSPMDRQQYGVTDATAEASKAMLAAAGDKPLRRFRSHAGLESGLDRTFAQHVSMTPPARFARSDVESPFGTVNPAITGTLTEARPGLPRSHAFATLSHFTGQQAAESHHKLPRTSTLSLPRTVGLGIESEAGPSSHRLVFAPTPSRIPTHTRARTEDVNGPAKRARGSGLMGNTTAQTMDIDGGMRNAARTSPPLPTDSLPRSPSHPMPAKRRSYIAPAGRNRASSSAALRPSPSAEPMTSRSTSSSGIEAAEEKLQAAGALFDFARKKPSSQTSSNSAPDLSTGFAKMSQLGPRETSSPAIHKARTESHSSFSSDAEDLVQSPAQFKAHRIAQNMLSHRRADSAESNSDAPLQGDDSALAFVNSARGADSQQPFPMVSTPGKPLFPQARLGAHHLNRAQPRSSLANEAFTRGSSDAGSIASSPSAGPCSARSQRTYTRKLSQPSESPVKKASHLQIRDEGPRFSTPQFKNVKPLQTAFMSTGLVSKRSRPRPELEDTSGSGESLQPLPPRPSFATSSAAAIGLREVVAAASAHQAASAANTSIMPDTPVKRNMLTAFKQPSSLRTRLGISDHAQENRLRADSPSPLLPQDSPLLRDSCESPTLALMSVDQNSYHHSAVKGWPGFNGAPGAAGPDTSAPAVPRSVPQEQGAVAVALPAATQSGSDSYFSREPASFIANRRKFLSSRSRPLSLQGLQRKTSMGIEQAGALFGGMGGGAGEAAALVSPGLGLGLGMGLAAIPRTPTRNHTAIKWFEAAQLVTTPSPTSHSSSRERGKRTVKSSLSAMPSQSTPRVGRVGRFESSFNVQSVLGTGEFSEVIKVEHKLSGGIFAVKRMNKAFTGPRDRLRRLEEVDILRHLQQEGDAHPNIIKLIDAWEEGGHLFLQTELCGLGTLAFFLEEYGCMAGNLDEPRLWKILAELSAGLQHIHSSGVLHLDLKPANVLITELGSLKIGDFGLATRWPPVSPFTILKGADMGDSEWQQEEIASVKRHGVTGQSIEREGDREYLAPEIMSGGRYGPEADLFSLGLVMLEAAGNVILPDNGEAWQKLRADDFTDVDLSHVSDQFVEIVFSLLDSSPGARPTINQIVEHPIMQAVRRRMALGVMNSELDQLPDFELPTIESGPLLGEDDDDDDCKMDTTEDHQHPPMMTDSQSAPALSSSRSALGLSFDEPPRKVLEIRGALIQELEEEFMEDILAYSEVHASGINVVLGPGVFQEEQRQQQQQEQRAMDMD